MKYLVPFLLFIASVPFTLNAQKSSSSKESTSVNEKVYRRALRYNDLSNATTSLLFLIEEKPETPALLDTLCFLYFQQNQDAQVVKLGSEILNSFPAKAGIRKLVGLSQKNLGLLKGALQNFEVLEKATMDPGYSYEIAKIQYSLKRYGECNTTLTKLLNNKEAANKNVSVKLTAEKSQTVLLQAAALNLWGILLMENKEVDKAKEAFKTALQIQPDFELAIRNLARVDQ